MTKISVVIVNFNGGTLLEQSLGSLKNQSLAPAEVILVDNNSQDDSILVAETIYPDITIIANNENRYFAAGANQGIAASNGEYILLLNNDCAIASDYLEIVAAQLDRDLQLGSAVGKIFRLDGETLDQAGQFISRTRTPLDRGYGEQDGGDYDSPEYVLSAGGVAPLMRRAMLDEIREDSGWFDEDFVQYDEDLDLFYRAHNFGWKSMYLPQATALHHRGATGQSEPAVNSWVKRFAFANLPTFLQKHLLKNRYMTIVKNDRLASFLVSLPFVIYYECKILVYSLLLKPSLFPKWVASLAAIGPALKKRKDLKRRARDKRKVAYGTIKLNG